MQVIPTFRSNADELMKLMSEGKYQTLEELQKFNPFFERGKNRLKFQEERRQLRDKERSGS